VYQTFVVFVRASADVRMYLPRNSLPTGCKPKRKQFERGGVAGSAIDRQRCYAFGIQAMGVTDSIFGKTLARPVLAP
jgi:hypothetical protein